MLFCESFDQSSPFAHLLMDQLETRLGIPPALEDEHRTAEEQMADLGKRMGQSVMLHGSLSRPDRDNLIHTMHNLVVFLSQMLTFLSRLSKTGADELEKCGVLADQYQRPEEQLRDAKAASTAVHFRDSFRDTANAKNEKLTFDAEFPLIVVPGNTFVVGRTLDGRMVWRRASAQEQLTATG